MVDLVCVGELLVDFVPTTQGQSLRNVPAFVKAAGGAPANVAVGFSRLGGKSRFVGKVGEDEFGYFLAETLAAAGVDTSCLFKTSEALTTLAFVSLRADGERDFIFYRRPGADMLLRDGEIDGQILDGALVFHFGSISLMSDPLRSATLKMAEMAAAAGTIVSFDPNLRPALWADLADARAAMLTGLARANMLKVSGEELAFMTGNGDTRAAAEGLLARYPGLRLVAVTLGSDGCLLVFRDRALSVPGFAVTAVDTTGAGDGFTAALQVALVRRLRAGIPAAAVWSEPDRFWYEAGRFANATGALVVTQRGGIPAMPDYGTVVEFLSGRG